MNRFVSREPVDAGWSGDRKYRVTDETGRAFLLRVAPEAALARKQTEFSYVRRTASLGVPMCRPVDVGLCGEGAYILYEWIDGEDAETVLPSLPPAEQYAYGESAGRALRLLHAIPAPETQEDWEARFNRKIDRKIAMYAECPLHYADGGAFLRCVAENRALLHGRPQCFQHGDYHTGNMRIGQDGRLYIIDFDRFDFGDPWEEFNRIVWSAQCAPRFAAGLVNGYFDGDVPLLFWRLLKLYISSNMLGSLPWAVPYGEAEVKTMQRQASEVLTWFTGMRADVPTWFS